MLNAEYSVEDPGSFIPRQERLFAAPPIELLNTEEFAEYISGIRALNLLKNHLGAEVLAEEMIHNSAHEVTEETKAATLETSSPSRAGGAFGGALKRRILLTDSAELSGQVSKRDRQLLEPNNILRELLSPSGDLAFRGVVFSPKEFKSITFSAETLSQRVGAQVLDNTTERPPTERHERKIEVIAESLMRRNQLVEQALIKLDIDQENFTSLQRAMAQPGRMLMTAKDIDTRMAYAEDVFKLMVGTVAANHSSDTERVTALMKTLESRLGDDNYRDTFTYTRGITNTGYLWTREKSKIFKRVQRQIQSELDRRS
jgi:hypothetical protein